MGTVKNRMNVFAVWGSKGRIAIVAFVTPVACMGAAKSRSIALVTKAGAACFAIKVRKMRKNDKKGQKFRQSSLSWLVFLTFCLIFSQNSRRKDFLLMPNFFRPELFIVAISVLNYCTHILMPNFFRPEQFIVAISVLNFTVPIF
jgi:hypothetical protein